MSDAKKIEEDALLAELMAWRKAKEEQKSKSEEVNIESDSDDETENESEFPSRSNHEDLRRKLRWRWCDQYRHANALQKEMEGPYFPREYYEYLAKVQRLLDRIADAGMEIENDIEDFQFWGHWEKGIFRMQNTEWKMTQEEALATMQHQLNGIRQDFLGWLNMSAEDRPLFVGTVLRLDDDDDTEEFQPISDVVYQKWLFGMMVKESTLEPRTGDAWDCTICKKRVYAEKHKCSPSERSRLPLRI